MPGRQVLPTSRVFKRHVSFTPHEDSSSSDSVLSTIPSEDGSTASSYVGVTKSGAGEGIRMHNMIPRPRVNGVGGGGGRGDDNGVERMRDIGGSDDCDMSDIAGYRPDDRNRAHRHNRGGGGGGGGRGGGLLMPTLIPPEVVTHIPPKAGYPYPHEPQISKAQRQEKPAGMKPLLSSRTDDDLSCLTSLDAASIKNALADRYLNNIIHTFIGDILIIINPYTNLGIYGPEYKAEYAASASVTATSTASKAPAPHVYWTAARAYRNLMAQHRNQCVFVSGESGAGKTESTKYLVEQLIHVCRGSSRATEDLHERIIKVNPLLEAFGNASTVMNRNSSRFGKYIEVFFTGEGKLTGAVINDYLLERSRVVQQGEGERNFHVFYYLFAGMPEDKKMYYCDHEPEHFRILTDGNGKCPVIRTEAEHQHCTLMFQNMVDILETVGFDDDDSRDGIWVLLFAILYITNIRFEYADDDEEGEIANEDELRKVSELLDVKLEDLCTHLLCMHTSAGDEDVFFMRTHEQAASTRDALAKELYGRLFGWIVKRINKKLCTGPQGNLSIGILDMAGFENFPTNGFEQFCINIANERLHTFFNEHVLREEQRAYEAEGVAWRHIEFTDNANILAMLLDAKMNMLLILDEQCHFPKATDTTLVAAWYDGYSSARPALATFDERSCKFAIFHYADDVTYDADGFLSKNRDRLDANLKKAMTQSLNVFVNDLFTAEETELGSISRTPTEIRTQSVMEKVGNRAKMGSQRSVSRDTLKKMSKKNRIGLNKPVMKVVKTMAHQFRASLQDLMKKMSKADPLFIRCVKPNSRQMGGGQLEDTLLGRQLQYNGVLQVAKIRKLGYPVRIPHAQFVKQYALASFPPSTKLPQTVASCHEVLEKSDIPREDWLVGKTKVFMRDKAADHIAKLTHDRAATIIQALLRRHSARQRCDKMKMEREERRRREEEEENARRQSDQSDHSLPEISGGESNGNGGARPRTPSVHLPLPDLPKDDDTLVKVRPESAISNDAEREDAIAEEEEQEEDDADWDFEEGDRPIWDMFQLIPRDRISPMESFEGMLKVMRLLMYLMLFLVVWVSATASVGCFLLLVGAASKGHADTSRNKMDIELRTSTEAQLLYILIFPLVITAIISFVKVLFGNYPWPSGKLWMGILIVELLHTFGVTLLVFRVFMYYGALYCICIMNGVCLVPAFLRMLFMRRESSSAKDKAKSTLKAILDIVAFLVLAGAVAVPIIVRHFRLGNYYWASDYNDGIEQMYVLPGNDMHMYWQVPCGIVFTSIKWWENFVDTNRGPFKLFDLKRAFHDTRMTANCVTSVLKVGVIVAIYFMLLKLDDEILDLNNFKPFSNPNQNQTLADTNKTSKYSEGENIALSLTPCIITILGSLLCYFFSVMACKLRMQVWSFSFALILASPTLAVVIILQCIDIIPEIPAETFANIRFEYLCDYGVDNYAYYPAAGAVYWLAFLWVTRYVWFPNADRLAHTEALFVTNLYSGPLIIQSMLLNRRSNDDSLRKDTGDAAHDALGLRGTLPNSDTPSGDTLLSNGTMDGRGGRSAKLKRPVPIIYACATMWHETRNEMMQLLKSIFRMDADQATRRIAQEEFNIVDPDYYEFEANVFFDDVIETDEKGVWVLNKFVKLFLGTLDEAASSVLEIQKEMQPPTKFITPYGGKLVWTLPGSTTLNVHLKDKNKIRHRKRWSQVMYMYYLLGFRLVEASNKFVFDAMNRNGQGTEGKSTLPSNNKGISWLSSAVRKFHATEHFAKSKVFYEMMSEPLVEQAENTFILALDGDVDFKPDAVKLLVDRLKINEKTGGACGRIHPIGSGPIVWYQIFEYAVGHWFQKATEHVLGCVLCSPGCFSLFRGSALMDDNVMRKYTTKAEQPSDYLQYDQGEDRWLCTLLLQQGYRIDYAAASDALTYAPETFNEFFNQRRRWTPSTMANIMDLLADSANTVRVNPNISFLYILYQFFLMGSTILGPGTIILAVATAFEQVLVIRLWQAYLLSIAPCVFYIVICFKTKTQTQLLVASFLSTFYAAVMLVVLVGIIKAMANDGILTPSLIFFVVVAISFIFAGLIHPYEIGCLVHGIIYFLCIPAGYLILMIYSLSNMHIVSWGTREVKKRLTPEQEAQAKAEAEQLEAEKAKKKSSGFLALFRSPDLILQEIKTTLTDIFSSSKSKENNDEVVKLLRKMYKSLKNTNRVLRKKEEWSDSDSDEEENRKKETQAVESTPTTPEPSKRKDKVKKVVLEVVEESNPDDWVKDKELAGPQDFLDDTERIFWENFIKKYLKPLKQDKKKEEELGAALIELRNNASFGFWLINGLWILFNYMISSDEDLSTVTVMNLEVQPLGFVFLVFYMAILVLQLLGMIIHRWGTFMQLISITEIPNPFRRRKIENTAGTNISPQEAIAVTRDILRRNDEPAPDYSDGEDDAQYEQLPEDQDSHTVSSGSTTEITGLRPRTPWRNNANQRQLLGTVRQRLSEASQYRYSPLPEPLLEQRRREREHTNTEAGLIELNPQRRIAEERRRRYLRGGGRATISRNFTVNNPQRRQHREHDERRAQQAFPQGRRTAIPFDRRPSGHGDGRHRSDGWLPHRPTQQFVPGQDFDRQFQRRMHQYVSSGGLPQSRRY